MIGDAYHLFLHILPMSTYNLDFKKCFGKIELNNKWRLDMGLKQQFRKPIHKQDLFSVIYQGLFMAFTGGILIGALLLLMLKLFTFELSWLMLFVLAILTARRIKQATHEKHIIFSIISVLAFILGYYIMNVTAYAGIFYIDEGSIFKIPFDLVLNPLFYFYFLYPLSSTFLQVRNILEIIFFLIGIYYAFQYSK